MKETPKGGRGPPWAVAPLERERELVSENRTIYEITWKDMVEPERPQVSIKYNAKKRCDLHA